MNWKERQDWLKEKYPLTVVMDRYNGTYSGAKFLAFPLDFDVVPIEVNGSDTECAYFWKNYEEPVGKGASAQDAIDDLVAQMQDEDEDERIRKALIDGVRQIRCKNGITQEQMIAWLEKQKDSIPYEKYVEDIAAIHAEAKTKYFEGWKDGYEEKQKWQEPETASASSIPSWEEKQKEQKPDEPKNWPADRDNLTQEQKPVEPSIDELQRHEEEFYNFKVFAAKQAREHHISFVHDFEWNNFCAELLSYLHERLDFQPKQEWSEEDEKIMQTMIKEGDLKPSEIAWLNSLRNRAIWRPSEDDKRLINTSISFLKDFADKGYENAVECIDWLKSLRPQPIWKRAKAGTLFPSEALVIGDDGEARLSKVAVNDCRYILVKKLLPQGE